jgi:hypothetical protein
VPTYRPSLVVSGSTGWSTRWDRQSLPPTEVVRGTSSSTDGATDGHPPDPGSPGFADPGPGACAYRRGFRTRRWPGAPRNALALTLAQKKTGGKVRHLRRPRTTKLFPRRHWSGCTTYASRPTTRMWSSARRSVSGAPVAGGWPHLRPQPAPDAVKVAPFCSLRTPHQAVTAAGFLTDLRLRFPEAGRAGIGITSSTRRFIFFYLPTARPVSVLADYPCYRLDQRTRNKSDTLPAGDSTRRGYWRNVAEESSNSSVLAPHRARARPATRS